jgi:hypothetical protein
MVKRRSGRPPKWTPAKRKELNDAFIDYLYETDLDGHYVHSPPNVSEFAFLHHISRQRLYEFPEVRETIELCKTKKEWDLETGGLSETLNPAMAIFSLKNLGWSDNPAINDYYNKLAENNRRAYDIKFGDYGGGDASVP